LSGPDKADELSAQTRPLVGVFVRVLIAFGDELRLSVCEAVVHPGQVKCEIVVNVYLVEAEFVRLNVVVAGVCGVDDCNRPLTETLTASVSESWASVVTVTFLAGRLTLVVV